MYVWVFALLFASILGSLCQQASLHMGRRIFVRATSICNAEVFAKSLRRKDVNSSLDSKEGEPKKDGEAPGKKKDGNTNISSTCVVCVLYFRISM
jgi:hypothetical protein